MQKPSGFPRELRLGPLRITGTVLVLTVLMVIFLAVSSWATRSPAFCGSCHEMRPEYYTWEASDHRNAGCIQCHTNQGAAGFLANKAVAVRETYKHLTGTYLLPIEVSQPVKDETCLRCHPAQWEHEASGDLKFSHQTHQSVAINCVRCHTGVAHGRLAERQQTIDGAFAAWTAAKGRSNMVQPFRLTGMKECMTCHAERDVPNTCETCHTKLVRPATHLAENFVKDGVHGKLAMDDLGSCNKCHSFTLSMVRVKAGNPVAEYARNNTFCTDCHKERPEGHNANWNVNHGARAQEVGPEACQVCHEATPPRKGQGVLAKTYCNQCHKQPHGIPQHHPVPIPPGPPTEACTRCHSRQSCGRCHTSLIPKRAPRPSAGQAQTSPAPVASTG